MSKIINKNLWGFSLVELLVYLASMTIILLAITYVLASTYTVYASMLADARADRSASTLSQILSTELRGGTAIDQSHSVFDVDNGQLTIDTYDGNNLITKSFRINDHRVVFTTDEEDTFMTPTDMEVTKLRFTQIVTPISYAIRYEMDVSYSVKGETVTKNYPGLVILRRSYE